LTSAILDAAVAVSPGTLFTPILDPKRLGARLGVAQGTVLNILGMTHRGPFWEAAANAVVERVLHDIRKVAEDNRTHYTQALTGLEQQLKTGDEEEIARGAQGALTAAVAADSQDFAPENAEATGREVAYLLALAANHSGAFTELFVDHDEALAEIYRDAYEGFIRVFGRRWADGDDYRSARDAIDAYLEGVAIKRRSGVAVTDEAVAGVVARIFLSFSVAAGDPAAASPFLILADDRSSDHGLPVSGYRAVLDAIEATSARRSSARTVDIAALHGTREDRALRPSSDAKALRDRLMELVAAGWRIRRLVAINSPGRLEDEEAWIASLPRGAEVEVRALPLTGAPMLAPLIIAGESAFLATDSGSSYGVDRVLALRSAASRRFGTEYFDQLWDDERAVRLRTLTGPRPAAFRGLSAQLARAVVDADTQP
jgi:hypothetical protein